MSGMRFALVPALVFFVLFFCTNTAEAQQLIAPTNFDGSATGTTSIQWTWDDTNSSPNETGHTVYNADNDLDVSGLLAADSTSWDETGLQENEKYNRYVKAIGGGGGEQLDQQNDTSTVNQGFYVDARFTPAQRFTAGMTGSITKVDLVLYRYATSVNSITVQIRTDNGTGLQPSTTVVASQSFSFTAGSWYWVPISFTTPGTVTSGVDYWIVCSCPDTYQSGYLWGVELSNVYDGVNSVADYDSTIPSWTNYDYDLFFRTYVDSGSGVADSAASNATARYTLVHDPVSGDYTITTTFGTLDVDISVTPPPNNPYTDLTGLKIRRGLQPDLSDGTVVKSYYAPGTTEEYDFTDTVPGSDTYYYGITFRNGDGIETAEHITGPIDVQGELPSPTSLTGTGTSTTTILWEWPDDVTGSDGYLLEDESGNPIAMLKRPADQYEETVSGENEPTTRQLCSVVLDSTSLSVEPSITGGFTWPWVSTGRRMQMLYLASELSSQAGNITKIYWKLNADTPGYSYTNVTVKLGHTTVSALGTNFAANFTEGDDAVVWDTPLYSVPAATGGDWIEIPITGTFFYNGVDNLIFEVNLESGTGDCSWSDNNTYTATSLYAPSGGSSGTVWNVKFLIKFDVDTIAAKSTPCGPVLAHSLVHDATVDDFGLALTANPEEVEVTVTPPLNQSSGDTGVQIERAEDAGFSSNLTTVQSFAVTGNYTVIDSVTGGTTYWYRITFQNGDATASATSAGESIYVPPVSDAPTVVINSPKGGVHVGNVEVWYTLSDPQAETCSAVVEYTTNSGLDWYTCTQAGGDNIASLTSSVSGTSHNYIWDTVASGVGATSSQVVTFKITPSDAAEEGTPGTTTFSVSNVIEQPPVAQITDPTGGSHSGVIPITFEIADVDGETASATVEYSFDGGTWYLCTPPSGTNPLTGLATDTTGIEHAFDWDSAANGVGLAGDESVFVRVTPRDDDGEGVYDQVSITVNNVPQEVPTVSITAPTTGANESGDITIAYTLADKNDDPCDITVEYTTNGSTWNPCAQGTGGDGLTGLTSNATGIAHTFVWDSVNNGVGTTGPVTTVQVRITPDDGMAGAGPPDVSGQFTVDNTASPFPNADFTADTTTGPASLTVQFTDLSTGNFDSWLWDFGDGGTSIEQSPMHVYYLVGTYTVTLRIDSPLYGSDSETKIDYITVTDPPGGIDADFTYTLDPITGRAPVDVQFTDLSVGNITTWEWDFDYQPGFISVDSTNRNPLHTYTTAGTYTVRLTVSGPGGSDFAERTIIISGGAAVPSKKKKSGCSCAVDTGPAPAGDVLGYFLPVILIAGAYLAFRRRDAQA